jgi:hypothetical protein
MGLNRAAIALSMALAATALSLERSGRELSTLSGTRKSGALAAGLCRMTVAGAHPVAASPAAPSSPVISSLPERSLESGWPFNRWALPVSVPCVVSFISITPMPFIEHNNIK